LYFPFAFIVTSLALFLHSAYPLLLLSSFPLPLVYEYTFLALVENLIARREQFISDAVIGGYPTASYFL
jgi:hypothetical protein